MQKIIILTLVLATANIVAMDITVHNQVSSSANSSNSQCIESKTQKEKHQNKDLQAFIWQKTKEACQPRNKETLKLLPEILPLMDEFPAPIANLFFEYADFRSLLLLKPLCINNSVIHFCHNEAIISAIRVGSSNRYATVMQDGNTHFFNFKEGSAPTEAFSFTSDRLMFAASRGMPDADEFLNMYHKSATLLATPLLSKKLTNNQIALLLTLDKNLKSGKKNIILDAKLTTILTKFPDTVKSHLVECYGISEADNSML